MKLVIAIVSNDDAHVVLSELNRNDFRATKLSTSGGFLRAGNVTLLIGVDDEKLDQVIGILKEFSSQRTELTLATPSYSVSESFLTMPVEITTGGATVFVLDVEQFLRL